MRRSSVALLAAAVVFASILLSSCDHDAPGAPEAPVVLMQILDAAHDGTVQHFYFLPPLTPAPDYQGAFDGSLLPYVVVEVCEWAGSACGPLVARFSADGEGLGLVFSSEDLEHYLAIWRTDASNVLAGRVYRATVLVAGAQLGYVDIKVVRTLSEARLVDRTQYAVAVKRWPVPIRFRIEEGAVWAVGPDGGTVTAEGGVVQLTVPSGALTNPTGITVDPATDLPTGADVVPGTAFDFGPDGLTFSPPAQLTIKYDEAQLPPGLDEQSILLLHVVDGRWQVVAGTVVDVAANTVTGSITGFSGYAVGSCACVVSVEVRPIAPTLVVGATQQFSATPRDAAGNELAGLLVEWDVDQPSIATISESGLLTALNPGMVAVIATVEGISRPVVVTVVSVAQIEVSPGNATIEPGETQQLTAIPKDNLGTPLTDAEGNLLDLPVTWTSGDDAVAPVDATGLVTGVAPGVATITATTSEGLWAQATILVNAPPEVTISSPSDGARVALGQSITFSGTATDLEDGAAPGATMVWTSSFDGQIGAGMSFSTSTLSERLHTITLTATDTHGATGTAAIEIAVVNDQQPPSLTAPAALTVGTNVGCTYTGPIGTATATDDLSSGSSLITTNDAPASFPLGATTVTWTATDAAGNSSSATQVVTVVDDDAPIIAAPASLTVGTNSGATYVGPIGSATASDNCSSGAALAITNDAPASFPLGATTVTWTVTDAAGNSASATQVVTVIDDDAPTITPPGSLTVGTNVGCTYTGPIGTATATDDISSGSSLITTNDAPASFPLGATTVTWTATDAAGNSTSATQVVTVVDDDAPTITAPASLTVGTNSGATYVGPIGTATATDNCSSGAALTITNDAPASFPIGTTTVTWTATDAAGNSVSATQVVTVIDDQAPILAVPGDLIVEASGPAGAVVSYPSPTATDDTDPSPVISCTPASGATFSLGTTSVTCSATDASGNSTSATFTVTVRDTTPPAVAAPANLMVEATSAAGATVIYPAATASDAVSTPTISYSHASGSIFPLGTTTVTVTAIDASGNSSTASFTVTVRDTTPPAVAAPANVTVEATGPEGAPVSYPPAIASDAVSTPTITYSHASGSVFPLGTTTVTVTATDAAGNSSTATFTITVVDTTPPAVAAPANLMVEATSASGATVSYPACTASGFTGVPTISYSHPSGAVFPLGSTTVTCTATDAAGNSASATFTVTVVDTTPPAVAAPANLMVEATSAAGATVSYPPAIASDAVSTPTITYSHASGSVFPLGTTTVTVTATDASGNSSTASFTVTVRDTTPPALTAPANVTVVAADAVGAPVSYPACTASDAVSSPTISYSHASGAVFPVGTTTVTCTATDAAGNSATATFQVIVSLNAPPTATISSPAAGATFAPGASVSFSGSGTDPEDGSLTGASLVWTSNLDGQIGTGTSFSTSGLSTGSHTITLTVTDSHGATGATTVQITIGTLGSITLPGTLNVSLGNTASLPIFLSSPAPVGGVTASVTSSDPQNVRIVTPTVSFVPGQQAANATVAGDAPGTATVQVTAAGYNSGQSLVTTLANLNILQSSPVTFAQTFPPTIDIRLESGGTGAAAPQGGLTLALSAADPACVQAPSPLTIPAGQVTVQATLTYGGSATLPCTTTLTASATNVDPDAIQVTVQPTPSITAGQAVTVGGGLQRSNQGQLGTGAHGGVTVTIASSDPAKLLVAPDPQTAGSASTTIGLTNGQTTIVYYMQALASNGTVDVTVSAPGFKSGTVTIGLVPARFDVSVLTTMTTLSPDAPIVVRVGVGNETSITESQAVRAGGSALTATVTNSDATVAQLVTSPLPGQTVTGQSAMVQIQPGQSSSPSALSQGGVALDPIGAGQTTVAATIPGLTATAGASRQVNVTGAPITAGSPHTVGKDLQRSNQGTLGASQHGGVTVTLTSSDPTKLLLAPNATTPGAASTTVGLLNGQTTIIYHMQALVNTGTVTVTASAPGFTDGTVTITLAEPALDVSGLPTSTTALSPSTAFTVRVGIANATQTAMLETQAVRAGGSALTATITNDNASAAQLVTTSTTGQSVTVQIPAGQSTSASSVAQGGVAFDPVGVGQTTVAATIPNLTALPTATRQVNVTGPPITAGSPHTVGKDLQRSNQGTLGASQHGGVTVTLTSSDPTKLLLAPNATTPGAASTTVGLLNGQTTIIYHMQALASSGTVTVTASAPGFTDGTVTITLAEPALDVSGLPTSTTALSPNTGFTVRVGIANATQTAMQETQAVRAGGSAVTATITNNNASAAQLVTTSTTGQSVTVQVPPGQSTSPSTVTLGGVAFDPVGVGLTTVAASIPNVFALPTATRQVNVTGPPITAGSPHTVGKDLQRSNQGTLGASQHGGVTVTLTSSDPAKLLVAPDATTPGSASTTVGLLNGQTTIIYHMQALVNTGTVTVTASAPGFTDGTVTITLAPPVLDVAGLPTTTTTLSPDVAFTVRVGIANATQTAMLETQAVRAGASTLTVTVTNTDATVAHLVTSAGSSQSVTLQIPPGQSTSPPGVAQGGAAFHALNPGTTTVAGTIPNLVALPTASRQVVVNTPTITAGAQRTVGGGLQRSNQGTLGASQHGGVTVTLTSSDPTKLLLAPDANTPGSASTTVGLLNGQTTIIYHMQALASSGTVTVTASAPGFIDGTVFVILAQPALDISGLPASPTAGSANVAFTVRVGIPNSTQTGLLETQTVRAGGAALTATVTNSAAAVAQLVTSSATGQSVTVEIQTGQSVSPSTVAQGGVAFDPLAAGSTTVAATIPGVLATTAASRAVTVQP